jgi:hypothetical protein
MMHHGGPHSGPSHDGPRPGTSHHAAPSHGGPHEIEDISKKLDRLTAAVEELTRAMKK